jgi:hypothetical protein
MPSREDWPKIMRAISDERIALSVAKNSNYAGGDAESDAFSNFNLVEILTHGRVTREVGIFVRLCDKVARLGNVMFGAPDAVGESVEDTLKDLANYADITLAAWREKHPAPNLELEADSLLSGADIPLPAGDPQPGK